MLFVYFLGAGFLLFVFDSAPAALSQFPALSLGDDLRSQALMGLLRGNVVDAGMVMLRVIPGKVSFEIGDGLVVIQESPRILRGAFDGAEGDRKSVV